MPPSCETLDFFSPNSEATLASLWRLSCQRQADKDAVVCGNTAVSFIEIESRAQSLARILNRKYGVGPDCVVGLNAKDRTIGTIVSMVAIIKAGGAYCPLDPSAGRTRVKHMTESAEITVILSSEDGADTFAGLVCPVQLVSSEGLVEEVPNLAPSDDWCEAAPQDLAYVIYTSGSTGKPKGVMAEQQGASALVQAYISELGVSLDDRIIQQTPLTFDVHVSEVWVSLISGATLVLLSDVSEDRRFNLGNVLVDTETTIVNLTPTHLSTLDPGQLVDSNLRLIVTSGEVLQVGIQEPWIAKSEGRMPTLVNAYGMTECNTCSFQRCYAGNPYPLSLGHPLPRMHYMLLDESLNHVEKGELVIAGVQVGRGYISDPGQTSKAFIPNPWYKHNGATILEQSRLLYRTGDICQKLPDGTLACVGRRDNQVKVHGHRVDLGDIEQGILGSPMGVRQCTVTMNPGTNVPGTEYLVAYVASDRSQSVENVRSLHQYLTVELPPFMLPAAYVFLPSLPTTSHDKVDRKSLPKPQNESFVRGQALQKAGLKPVAPSDDCDESSPVLQVILAAFRKALGHDDLQADDDLFASGSNSVISMNARNLLRQQGIDVSVEALYSNFTSRSLAAHVGELAESVKPCQILQSAKYRIRNMERRDTPKLMDLYKQFMDNVLINSLLEEPVDLTDFESFELDRLIEEGMSFVCVDENDQVVGASWATDAVNMHTFSDFLPPGPTCGVLQTLQDSIRDYCGPIAKGEYIYQDVVSIDLSVIKAGNAMEPLALLDQVYLEYSRNNGYIGTFCIDVHPVTVSNHVDNLGYHKLQEIRYSDFVYEGTRPFAHFPSSLESCCSVIWKCEWSSLN